MPIYIYTGVDSEGKRVRGIVESSSKATAIQKLKKERIIITKIQEKGHSTSQPAKSADTSILASLRTLVKKNISFSRITKNDLAIFSKQLSSLLKSGLSLTESLDTIAKQTRKLSMKFLILSLSQSIKEGKSFSQALSENSRVFPEIYIGMIRTGEASGELDRVVDDLGNYLDKQIALQSKITSALVYPIFVVVVMGIVLWVLLSFVVPKIGELLKDVGKALPVYTKLLISSSEIFSNTLPYFIAIGVGIFAFRKKFLSVPKIRFYFDLFRLKVPIYSRIHLLGELQRIFSTLATLTRAGVPLVKAIETAESISINIHIKKALKEAREYVVEGRSMSEKLAEYEFFPPMIYNMVAVGERSGEIEKMFSNIAETLTSELETFIAGVTSLIEPILIVFIGGLIFFIMVSIIVPILEINRSIM